MLQFTQEFTREPLLRYVTAQSGVRDDHNPAAKQHHTADLRESQARRIHNMLAETKLGWLLGYAGVHDTPFKHTKGRTISRAGSYRASERTVALWCHDGKPLCRASNGTLLIRDDGFGLLVLANPDADHPAAIKCCIATETRDGAGMSNGAHRVDGFRSHGQFETVARTLTEVSFLDSAQGAGPANRATCFIATGDARARQLTWTNPQRESAIVAPPFPDGDDLDGYQTYMHRRAELRLLRYAAKLQGVTDFGQAKEIIQTKTA